MAEPAPRLTRSLAFWVSVAFLVACSVVTVVLASHGRPGDPGQPAPAAATSRGPTPQSEPVDPSADPSASPLADPPVDPPVRLEAGAPPATSTIVTKRAWGELTTVPRSEELPAAEVSMQRPVPAGAGTSASEARWTTRVQVRNAGGRPLPLAALTWRLDGSQASERWRGGLAQAVAADGADPGPVVAPGTTGTWDLTWVLPAEVVPDSGQAVLGRATVTWH